MGIGICDPTRSESSIAGLGMTTMAVTKRSSRQELSRQLAWSRREFLRTGAAMALGGTLVGNSSALAGGLSLAGRGALAGIPTKKRKVVVITFGGGARDQETFAPEGQE